MSDFGEQPTPEQGSASAMPPPEGPPVTAGYPPPPPAYGYHPNAYPNYPSYPPQYPGTYPPPAAYGSPLPYGYPRDHPRAGLALGLGIGGIVGGFFTLGLGFALGPFAWFFGQRSRAEIRRGGGAYHSDGNATAGMILGIIATVFLVLAAILWTLLFIGIATDPGTSDGTNALALISTLTARS